MSIINKEHFYLISRKKEFFDAQPFPYLVLDDFITGTYFDKLSTIFLDEREKQSSGKRFNTTVELKKWISLNSEIPGLVKEIIDELNSSEWLENLKLLTGMDHLLNTEVGNTKLANFHEMLPGGYLGPHVDHATDPNTQLPHVLNNLVYLSSEWDENYGGGTELFDRYGSTVVSKVEYKPNRAIIFLHTPYSFHGVERIAPNATLSRKSIYVDYYSSSLNPYKDMELPFPNHWFNHGTTFPMASIFDYLNRENFHYLKATVKYRINKFKVNCKVF
jgi:hypothetical protein